MNQNNSDNYNVTKLSMMAINMRMKKEKEDRDREREQEREKKEKEQKSNVELTKFQSQFESTKIKIEDNNDQESEKKSKSEKGEQREQKKKVKKKKTTIIKSDKFPHIAKVAKHKLFSWFHKLIAILSGVFPAISTYYDSNNDTANFDNVIKMTQYLLIPLLILHFCVNVITILNSLNGPKYRSWTYAILWFIYQFILILIMIVAFSLNEEQKEKYMLNLTNTILVLLLFEGIQFVISEFSIPRKLYESLVSGNIITFCYLYLTKYLLIYIFSFLGCILFKTAIHEAVANGNEWIEGNEFDNIIDSWITLLDYNDWSNGYLTRAIEKQRPGSVLFFMFYILLTRSVLDSIIVAYAVNVIIDPNSKEMILHQFSQMKIAMMSFLSKNLSVADASNTNINIEIENKK
jgi:hypothetical protein